ncbi:MAG: pilus assembly protein PilM [Candidatus Omnitrophica bacterium]|nr:pilus assembly protein PilM [Candidatus Omnitrophota bacterium]MCM8802000.1 pilus assembly protein PilM [Candidatus Omnitrophota bacterium]
MNLKICIDISEEFIKIIEGWEKKGKIYITNIEKIKNPIDNLEKIIEEDAEKLGNFLRDFLKKNKFKGKKTILSINDKDIYYHIFELPNLSKEEFENAIKLEGIQVIPDFIENYEYDYICFNTNNKKNVILLIAYPKNKIALLTKILEKAQLKPIIMDVNGIAALNSFLYFNQQENPVGILNFEFTISNLCIYLRRKFLLIRDIQLGIKNIGEITDLDEKISEFLNELKISLQYFQNKTGKSVNKIYLTGEAKRIISLKEIMVENLNLSVDYYNPLLNFPDTLISLDKTQDGISYAVCVGLLIRKTI